MDHLYRHHYGKMVAVLVRIFGLQHLETIEDAVLAVTAYPCSISWASHSGNAGSAVRAAGSRRPPAPGNGWVCLPVSHAPSSGPPRWPSTWMNLWELMQRPLNPWIRNLSQCSSKVKWCTYDYIFPCISPIIFLFRLSSLTYYIVSHSPI